MNMRTFLIILAVAAISGAVKGQTLVEDINQSPTISSMITSNSRLTDGSTFYFTQTELPWGTELWKTDGTSAGTVIVDDINPGHASADPSGLARLNNGRIVFSATHAGYGAEPWVTDGTAAGTMLLADIVAGSSGSSPGSFVSAGTLAFFRASTAAEGDELWVTDGTPAGTTLVRDIRPGNQGSGIMLMTRVQSRVYFVADDGTNGRELWISDGTPAGTTLVHDIHATSARWPENLTAFGTSLLFSATDPVDGRELWTSDGTQAGTVQLTNLNPSGDSDPSLFTVVGGFVLFMGYTGTSSGIYKTDGTVAGTSLVSNVSMLSARTVVGNLVVFSGESVGGGTEPWVTDGTSGGTFQLADIRPGTFSSSPLGFTTLGSLVVFSASSSAEGREPWVTDGTQAGTFLLRDVRPGIEDSVASSFLVAGGICYFRGNDGSVGGELWGTDGTSAGTVMVADVRPGALGSEPTMMGVLGNQVIFTAIEGTRMHWWISDGTAANTIKLRTPTPDTQVSNATSLGNFRGMAVLRADDGVSGFEPWISDGTQAGTFRLIDAAPGTTSGISTDDALHVVGDRMLFTARTATSARQLFASDGTVAGTVQLTNFTGAGIDPDEMVVFRGALYFQAAATPLNGELWRSDGTAAGTMIVRELNTGNAASNPTDFLVLGDRMYFKATGPSTFGSELWTSDGTAEGTTVVKDIRIGGGSNISGLAPVAGGFVFSANDNVTGQELWFSDGTEAGTVLVSDIFTGSTGSSPTHLTPLGNLVVFSASDASNGRELWVTDGTSGGTQLLADMAPGTGSSSPDNFTRVGNRIFFSAAPIGAGRLFVTDGTVAGTTQLLATGTGSLLLGNFTPIGDRLVFTMTSATTGVEVWASDGTVAGTVLLADIFGGVGSSSPSNFVRANQYLYFAATSDQYGREVWRTDGTAAGTTLVSDLIAGSGSSLALPLLQAGNQLFLRAFDMAANQEPFVISLGGAPELYRSGGDALFSAGGAAVVLDATWLVEDSNSADFDGGGFTAAIVFNADADDRLTIQNQGIGAGQVGATGGVLTYGGAVIGSYSGGSGSTPFTVSFTTSAATLAAVQAVLRVTQYSSVSATPPTFGRVVEFQITDDTLQVSPQVAVTVQIGGVATHLAITNQPAGVVAGTPFVTQPVVAIRDASGQVMSAYSGQVTCTLFTGPVSSTLGGTTTLNIVNGLATFTDLEVSATGNHVLRFESAGLLSVVSVQFTAAAPAVAQLVVTTQPGGAVAGVPFTTQPVIELRDASGLLITTDNSTQVTVEILSGTGTSGAVLSGTLVLMAQSGVVTYTNLAIDLSGSGYVLSFSTGTVPPVTSNGFVVTSPTATRLTIQSQPGSGFGGQLFGSQPVIRVEDNAGLLATGYVGVVDAMVVAGPTGGMLFGTTQVSVVNGVATFTDLGINLAGQNYQIEFTSGALQAATTSTFDVSIGPPVRLEVAVQPANSSAGAVFATQPSVHSLDLGGNIVQASHGHSVTVMIAPATGSPGATLQGTTTVGFTGPTWNFLDLRIDLAGSGYVLEFSAPGLTGVDSDPFDILASTGVTAVISQQPGGALGGTPFAAQPVVEIHDAFGNIDTSFTGTALAILQGGATGAMLSGTAGVPFANGVAAFTDLSIDTAGVDYELVFDVGIAIASVTSSLFDVLVGPAASLAILQQPSGATKGKPFASQPIVHVTDAGGNTVSTDNTTVVNVTIAPGTGALGAVLAGTAVSTAVSGVVTFTDLQIDESASGYVLEFSAPGLTGVQSDPFAVRSGKSGGGGDEETCTTAGNPRSTIPMVLLLLLALVRLSYTCFRHSSKTRIMVLSGK